MKKLIVIAGLLTLAAGASAQSTTPNAEGLRQIVVNLTILVVIYLVSAFIIKIMQTIQGNRLKDKLMEKGVPDTVVEQFLKPAESDAKDQSVKIFLVLAAAGIALFFIGYFEPTLITGLGIMCISLALAFLAYFFYLKLTKK